MKNEIIIFASPKKKLDERALIQFCIISFNISKYYNSEPSENIYHNTDKRIGVAKVKTNSNYLLIVFADR